MKYDPRVAPSYLPCFVVLIPQDALGKDPVMQSGYLNNSRVWALFDKGFNVSLVGFGA